MLDLSGVLAPKEGRDIEVITQEILDAKRRGGEAILTIGRCLTEAKQTIPHGEWLPWLNERVEFSERTARNFMRLSREWSNHVVGGEEKTVIDMTSRELERAIRERKEAQEAAAKAQAEASAAEQARAKMAEDMKLLNARLSGAQEDREQAAQAVARLEAQLAELKEKPVEVAVETVVDQAAIEKARAEAVAGMQDKLDKAREAKKRAEDKQKIAEEALEQARLQLEGQAREEKKAALGADKDLAQFEVLFDQTQSNVYKMQGILLKVRGRDETAAGKLCKAIRALAEAVGRCAE